LTADPTRRLPPRLVEHAREFLTGDRAPVAPKDAATVVLLRAAGAGVEVYLLRRHLSMAFAAGMSVFPGGTVDPRDFYGDIGWAGPSPKKWARAFGCPRATARALVCAAVRETFEESGVLLAGPSAESVVPDTSSAGWEADRAALVDRSLCFAEFLQQRRLTLRSDLLRPWAHWITPEFEPRRYDTRFFLAALPDGQVTRDVSGEADSVAWLTPDSALAAVDRGEMAMLPPTYRTLREIADFDTVQRALAAADERVISPVLPQVRLLDDGGDLAGVLTLPGDPP
jgi:8-oxo-dGTP pyrophosphatase MutT (NUDIX family)